MGCIQLVLSDPVKAETLRGLLARSSDMPVRCVDMPDYGSACVVVMDGARFREMGAPISRPDRLVLITSNDADHLGEAWDAGVNSVLNEQDSLNTVVLAVLAACLNAGTGKPRLVEQREQ
jgi:hypothetical protein